MRKNYIIALAVVIAVLFGAGVVNAAPGNFWDKVAEIVGLKIAEKVQVPNFDALDEELGAAGDINNSPRVIVKSRSTGTATTSVQLPAYPVVIDRVFFSAQGDGTTVTTSIHIGLGTTSSTVGTDLSVSSTFAGGSGYTYAASSTFPTIGTRYAATSSYVLCYTSDGVTQTSPSSTAGICGVEFWPL